MNQIKEFSNWRVLIIDDEPDNLMLAAITLEFNGAVVSTAPDGQSGIEQADTFQPTLILLDLSMPGLDGWEVFKRLRAKPEYDLIPIIALTANAMPDDAARVKDMGFDGYITKPFRVVEFLEALKESVATFAANHAASRSMDTNKPVEPPAEATKPPEAVKPLEPNVTADTVKPPDPVKPSNQITPIEPAKPLETVTGENHA